MSSTPIKRSSIQLYKDCLRLAKHIGGSSKKGAAIRQLIRSEFDKARNEVDADKIEMLKSNAIRGLSNYLMMANASKDQKLRSAMDSKNKDVPKDAEYRNL